MDLGEVFEVTGLDFFDAALIYNSLRDHALGH
jgi:hypothetical protein